MTNTARTSSAVAFDWKGAGAAARKRINDLIGLMLPADHPEATPCDILRDMSEEHEGDMRAHLLDRAAMYRHMAAGCYPASRAKPFSATADALEADANRHSAIWYPMSFHGRMAALEWSFTALGMDNAARKACLERGPIGVGTTEQRRWEQRTAAAA